jgi:hypothetical protein
MFGLLYLGITILNSPLGTLILLRQRSEFTLGNRRFLLLPVKLFFQNFEPSPHLVNFNTQCLLPTIQVSDFCDQLGYGFAVVLDIANLFID